MELKNKRFRFLIKDPMRANQCLNFTGLILDDDPFFIVFQDRNGQILRYNKSYIISMEEVQPVQ